MLRDLWRFPNRVAAYLMDFAESHLQPTAILSFIAWIIWSLASLAIAIVVGAGIGDSELWMRWASYPPHWLGAAVSVWGLITCTVAYSSVVSMVKTLEPVTKPGSDFSSVSSKALASVRNWRILASSGFGSYGLVLLTFILAKWGGTTICAFADPSLISAAIVMGILCSLIPLISQVVRRITNPTFFKSDLKTLKVVVKAGRRLQYMAWVVFANVVGYIFLAGLLVADKQGFTMVAYLWIAFGVVFGIAFFLSITVYLDRLVRNTKIGMQSEVAAKLDNILVLVKQLDPTDLKNEQVNSQFTVLTGLSMEIEAINVLDMKLLSAFLSLTVLAFSVYQLIP